MSLPAITVPNVAANLGIGRGIVSWSVGANATTPTWIDLGECSSFALGMQAKTLEHFSSRAGLKTRDMLINYEFTATLKFKLEEVIPQNIRLAAMGTVSGEVITGMNTSQLLGEIKFAGNNAIGWKYDWLFTNVSLTPSSNIELIGDTWQELEITANLLATYDTQTPPVPFFFTTTRTG